MSDIEGKALRERATERGSEGVSIRNYELRRLGNLKVAAATEEADGKGPVPLDRRKALPIRLTVSSWTEWPVLRSDCRFIFKTK
jgi:hypothetical protein